MASPKPIFGCASIGHSYRSKTQVVELSQTLEKVGVDHLDTAARYPPTSPGLSEQLLGEAQASHSFLIDTKILVSGDGRGSLTEEAIGRSIKQSYDSLGASRINILYCHAPDKQTRIAAQAAAFDKYHRDGKFSHVRRDPLDGSCARLTAIEAWCLQLLYRHARRMDPGRRQGRLYQTGILSRPVQPTVPGMRKRPASISPQAQHPFQRIQASCRGALPRTIFLHR